MQLEPEAVEALQDQLLRELDQEREKSAAETTRQQARISKLEQERRRVADCVLNGSVPEDIGREKQEKIRKELAKAHELLSVTLVAQEDVETTLRQALDLVSDCEAAYRAADDDLRREWNQAVFVKLCLDEDGMAGAELAPPFGILLAKDASKRVYRREAGWPEGSPSEPLAARLDSLTGTPESHGGALPEHDDAHEGVLVGVGSSQGGLAPTAGFEPAAFCSGARTAMRHAPRRTRRSSASRTAPVSSYDASGWLSAKPSHPSPRR